MSTFNSFMQVWWSCAQLLHCATWNVGDQMFNGGDLAEFLGVRDQPYPDIICICLQEVVKDDTWTSAFKSVLAPKDFVLVKVRNIWAIWTYVFAKRDMLQVITNIESECTASGYAGVMANKGGVTIRMDVYGVNFAAVCAHFTAHLENNKERLNDYMDIIKGQQFRDPDVDVVLDHDYVFWMGDLNFRIDAARQYVLQCIEEKRLAELHSHDQLFRLRKDNLIFNDFMEGALSFPPTYKFDPGTDKYDSSEKQRIPAWTDRILYLVHKDLKVPKRGKHRKSPKHTADTAKSTVTDVPTEGQLEARLINYTSLPGYLTSDHKPVVADFLLAVYNTWPPLPVTFLGPTEDVLPSGADLEFTYRVPTAAQEQPLFSPDSRDWVGLYLADFFDAFTGYLTYVYAPSVCTKHISSEEGVTGKIERKYLEQAVGKEVVLVYFSKKKNCPQGYSRKFKVGMLDLLTQLTSTAVRFAQDSALTSRAEAADSATTAPQLP